MSGSLRVSFSLFLTIWRENEPYCELENNMSLENRFWHKTYQLVSVILLIHPIEKTLHIIMLESIYSNSHLFALMHNKPIQSIYGSPDPHIYTILYIVVYINEINKYQISKTSAPKTISFCAKYIDPHGIKVILCIDTTGLMLCKWILCEWKCSLFRL